MVGFWASAFGPPRAALAWPEWNEFPPLDFAVPMPVAALVRPVSRRPGVGDEWICPVLEQMNCPVFRSRLRPLRPPPEGSGATAGGRTQRAVARPTQAPSAHPIRDAGTSLPFAQPASPDGRGATLTALGIQSAEAGTPTPRRWLGRSSGTTHRAPGWPGGSPRGRTSRGRPCRGWRRSRRA